MTSTMVRTNRPQCAPLPCRRGASSGMATVVARMSAIVMSRSVLGDPPMIDSSPPSTRTTSPVTKDAWLDSRKLTTLAISSGCGRAAERMHRIDCVPHRVLVVGQGDGVAQHRRIDRSRRHRVRADAVPGEVDRDRLHQADQAVLGGGVGGDIGLRRQPLDRGHEDDGALRLDQMRQRRVGDEEAAGQIDRNHLVPALGRRRYRGSVPLDAGVVRDPVERAEGVDRGRHRLPARPPGRPPTRRAFRPGCRPWPAPAATALKGSSAISSNIRSAPSAASRRATAAPIPIAAPVTSATANAPLPTCMSTILARSVWRTNCRCQTLLARPVDGASRPVSLPIDRSPPVVVSVSR